jgi:DNA-binding CsgD family transcriptional regulator
MNIRYETILFQAKQIWEEMTKEHPDQSENRLYDKESLDLLSKNSHTVIAILSLKSYKRLYVSSNANDVLGNADEYESKFGIVKFIRMMTSDHILFPITAGRWYIKCLREASFEEKINQRIAFVGPKMKVANDKTVRILVQTTHLNEDAERNPINIINAVQNATYLMKADFWWMRYSYGEGSQKVKYYHSDTKKTTDGDILSDREKDILRLIQEGQDSIEIAETLFLSLATVHTHRRNMLARTGMKDITALLQVAISIGMI